MKKALVLAILCAFGLGAGVFAQGTLSGSWDSSICIDVQSAHFDSFTSVLTVDYTISGWTFESVSTFALGGWTGQEFYVDGVLGAFTIGSDIVFDPAAALFTYWYNSATVNLAGVALDFETILLPAALADECQTPSMSGTGFGMAIGVSGGQADLTFDATLYLNSEMFDLDCDGTPEMLVPIQNTCICFTSIEIGLTFPFCCIDLVDVSVGFSATGFDGITITLSDIILPNLAWMVFDVTLEFDDQTDGKTLTLTPSLDLGDFACITIYADLCVNDIIVPGEPADNCDITGLYIYGIGLECPFNDCTFSSISSLDPAYNEELTGYAEYWEKFCIECGGDSCCGGAFSFEVCTYFATDSAMLFDWGETDISLAFGISSNFDLTTDLVVTDAGFVSWCIGFVVTW